jgi:biopolymer transport protein ExbD
MSRTRSRSSGNGEAVGFNFKSRFQRRASIDITPLIDLSFNLILFFMVSYSIGNVSAITVHLPRAVQAEAQRSGELVITISEKNEVYLNDVGVRMDALLDELRKRKEGVKDGAVVIRGDKLTNYETIVRVMDHLNRAGIPKFTLATTRSAE